MGFEICWIVENHIPRYYCVLYVTDHVLEYDVPSDYECPELADADVRVHVRGTGFRDASAELGVAQRGQH